MTTSPTLLVNLSRGFSTFYITEIYMGPGGTGSGITVPNPNDMIVDWSNGIYRVLSIDMTINGSTGVPNYTPTLELMIGLIGGNTNLGLSVYQPSAQSLAFLDTQVSPYTITIDDKYRSYGTEITYALLFQGSDITNTGNIVSQMYNGSGQYISQQIPLEIIDNTNPAIKRPVQFNTNVAMNNGEVVTLVNYTSSGGPSGIASFLIMNSNAIRSLSNVTVYITDVVLVSPLLNQLTGLVNVPQNIPIIPSQFQARLLYSNGNTALINIDDTKCFLYGLSTFNTSQAGVESTIVLTYLPSPTEPAINLSNPNRASISHTYTIQTSNNVLNYSFKIFVIPSYNTSTSSFTLSYYLTNLSYTMFIPLNSNMVNVSLAVGGGVPNYTANTAAQRINISVPMANVVPSGGYGSFNFVESFTITFGNPVTTPWIIDYLNNGTNVYGAGLYASYSSTLPQVVNISSSFGSTFNLAGFLSNMYNALQPIYDQTTTLVPPVPDHFQLIYEGIIDNIIYSLNDYWDINIQNNFGVNFVQYTTLTVVFLQQNPINTSQYLTIGVAPLMLLNTLT